MTQLSVIFILSYVLLVFSKFESISMYYFYNKIKHVIIFLI